jgi:hypothetical protein
MTTLRTSALLSATSQRFDAGGMDFGPSKVHCAVAPGLLRVSTRVWPSLVLA